MRVDALGERRTYFLPNMVVGCVRCSSKSKFKKDEMRIYRWIVTPDYSSKEKQEMKIQPKPGEACVFK